MNLYLFYVSVSGELPVLLSNLIIKSYSCNPLLLEILKPRYELEKVTTNYNFQSYFIKQSNNPE